MSFPGDERRAPSILSLARSYLHHLPGAERLSSSSSTTLHFFQGVRELPWAETSGGGRAHSIGVTTKGQKEPGVQWGALCFAN